MQEQEACKNLTVTYCGINSLNTSGRDVNSFSVIFSCKYCPLSTECNNHNSTASLEQNGSNGFGITDRANSQASDYLRLSLIETQYIDVLANVTA